MKIKKNKMINQEVFKELDSTESRIRSLYFEARVKKVILTPNSNFLVMTNNPRYIYVGTYISKKRTKSYDMNFLVPKRRVRVIDKLKYLKKNEYYVFKLTRETRSNKFVVSEIFANTKNR